MKIETTTGRYAITVEGSILTEKKDELALLGLSQGVLYRGVFAELREKTGAKRKLEDSAAFTQPVADAVGAAVMKALLPFMGATEVAVTEYSGGEAVALKLKGEIAKASEHESKGDLAAWLAAKVGFTGPTHGEDGEFARPMLLAIKAKVDGLAKAAAAKALLEAGI